VNNVKSGLLDELRELVKSCELSEIVESAVGGTSLNEVIPHRMIDNIREINRVIKVIDSLGENAHRMFEIGIVQDELVKLGFKPYKFNLYHIENIVSVSFSIDMAIVYPWNKKFRDQDNFVRKFGKEGIPVTYNSITFHEDVINHVKELINNE